MGKGHVQQDGTKIKTTQMKSQKGQLFPSRRPQGYPK